MNSSEPLNGPIPAAAMPRKSSTLKLNGRVCRRLPARQLPVIGGPCDAFVEQHLGAATRRLVAVAFSLTKGMLVRSELHQGLNAHEDGNKCHQAAGKVGHLAGQITEPAIAKAFANLVRPPCSDHAHTDH